MKKQLEVILSNLEDSVKDLRSTIDEMPEPADEPVVGDLCQLWDEKGERMIGRVSEVVVGRIYPYRCGRTWFKYARKISVSKLRELIEGELL